MPAMRLCGLVLIFLLTGVIWVPTLANEGDFTRPQESTSKIGPKSPANEAETARDFSPSYLHTVIEQILSDKAFQAKTSRETGWLSKLSEWLSRWWKSFAEASSRRVSIPPLILRAVSLVLGAFLFGLIFLMAKDLLKIRIMKKVKSKQEEHNLASENIINDAEAKGDFLKALRFLYRHTLALIFPAYNRTMPSRELISLLSRSSPEAASKLDLLTYIFNRSFYGAKALFQEDYQRAKGLCQEIISEWRKKQSS